MGLVDTATAMYMRQNEIFADIFNFFVYNGEKVIDPDSLQELDTREIGLPYGRAEGAEQPIQRTRDVVRSVVAMTDDRAAYLIPVVTLVVYWGAEHWDGPCSIHEMFDEKNETILPFVPDYHINLIEPAAISDSDFEKFHTTLKEVLEFIKYSADPDRLLDIVDRDDIFRSLGRPEMEVLRACVNKKLPVKREEEEEKTDMKDAITILEERAAEKAAKEATKEATIVTAMRNMKGLMETMGLTAEQAMDAMQISDSDRAVILERL